MWLSLSDQTVYFLSSLVFGAVLGVLYDLLRLSRALTHPSTRGVIVGDILFCTLCGMLTALFSIPYNFGEVRLFIILGEGVGFLLYRLTVGTLTPKLFLPLSRFLRLVVKKSLEILTKIYTFLLKSTRFVVYNVVGLLYKLLHLVHPPSEEPTHEREEPSPRRHSRRHRIRRTRNNRKTRQ